MYKSRDTISGWGCREASIGTSRNQRQLGEAGCFVQAAHQVHVLDRLDSRSLHEVVDLLLVDENEVPLCSTNSPGKCFANAFVYRLKIMPHKLGPVRLNNRKEDIIGLFIVLILKDESFVYLMPPL